MNNTTADTNQTLEWLPHSTIFSVLNCVCSTWTIIVNIVILVCFYRSRSKPWSSFTRLTFSMTTSDMLVGFTGVPFLVRDLTDGKMPAFICSSVAILCLSVEIVTLFHVLGICILRNIKLQFVSVQNAGNQDKKYTTCIIVASWVLPFAISVVPYVLWGKFRLNDILCVGDALFGSNVSRFTAYVSIFYFASQCITVTVYLLSVLRLWIQLRRSTSSCVASTDISSVDASVSQQERGTDNKATKGIAATKLTPSFLRHQKRVFKTIGILLVLFSLFTLPITIGTFLTGRFTQVNKDMIHIVNILFIVNSGINPIVYATRTKFIKESFKELFGAICAALCRCR